MGRVLTDYEHDQMCMYGACAVCGGPRTGYLTVEIANRGNYPPAREDMTIMSVLRCLWCGYNPG